MEQVKILPNENLRFSRLQFDCSKLPTLRNTLPVDSSTVIASVGCFSTVLFIPSKPHPALQNPALAKLPVNC